MKNQDLPTLMMQAARQQDRDRYLCAMFFPADIRFPVMTVLAFHAEVARIRGSVSEPLIAAIRLQWWRDALEKDKASANANPVVAALRSLPQLDALKPHLMRILDVRQDDLDFQTFTTAEDAEAWVMRTTEPLADALLCVVIGEGSDGRDVVRAALRAHGLLGVLRMSHSTLAAGTPLWDANIQTQDERIGLAKAVVVMAELAVTEVCELQRQVPRTAFPVLLLVPLVRQFIQILNRNQYEILDPKFYGPARLTVPVLWALVRKKV